MLQNLCQNTDRSYGEDRPHQLADGGQRVEFDGVTTRPHSRFLRQGQIWSVNRLGVNRVAICVCAFRCASLDNCPGPSATWM